MRNVTRSSEGLLNGPSSRGQSLLNKSVPWKKVSQMQMLYRGNSIQGGSRYYKKCPMDRGVTLMKATDTKVLQRDPH